MRDNRQNQRSTAGKPTGQLLADQRETVTEAGPFAQLHWEAGPRVLLLGESTRPVPKWPFQILLTITRVESG